MRECGYTMTSRDLGETFNPNKPVGLEGVPWGVPRGYIKARYQHVGTPWDFSIGKPICFICGPCEGANLDSIEWTEMCNPAKHAAYYDQFDEMRSRLER